MHSKQLYDVIDKADTNQWRQSLRMFLRAHTEPVCGATKAIENN